MRSRSSRLAQKLEDHVDVFAALGDRTRLRLVHKLTDQGPRSISQLTEGTKISRQAVSKHLRVLEDAGLVESIKAGREILFELNPRPLDDLRDYLEAVSNQWDGALARLKAFVED